MELRSNDMRTYSLTEVAEMALPPEMRNPERWLAERLRDGRISGYRIGRIWRMTQTDVDELINQHRRRTARAAREQRDTNRPLSLTARSKRRFA